MLPNPFIVCAVSSAKGSSSPEDWDSSLQVNKLHISIWMKEAHYLHQVSLWERTPPAFLSNATGQILWWLIPVTDWALACPDIRFYSLLHGSHKCLAWSYACSLNCINTSPVFYSSFTQVLKLEGALLSGTLYEYDSSHLISVVSQMDTCLLVSLYRQWKRYFWNIFYMSPRPGYKKSFTLCGCNPNCVF